MQSSSFYMTTQNHASVQVPEAKCFEILGGKGGTQTLDSGIMSAAVKPLEFRGSALVDLRRFPISARRELGYQLDQVQQGLEPDAWKSMPIVGRGVQEIRVRDAAGAFRILYVAKFADAVLCTALLCEEDPKDK
jgi:phage-related protein